MKKKIIIYAPARIHIGFLDLDKNSNRNFGSIGLSISHFAYKIKIESSQKMVVESKSKELKKKIDFIIKTLKKGESLKNCKITVLKEIPIHNGLGSGTQLSLALANLICKFNNIKFDIGNLAQLLKRGMRSGVGIQTFKHGCFNIDVGKAKGSSKSPLNILKIKWPNEWKILLIIDKNLTGIHGANEINKFKELSKVSKNHGQINCQSLLMRIIPGLIEKNFKEFSNGIRIIQDNMSEIFYGNKKKFASKYIEKIFLQLSKKGIKSFGQSSWGPTGFIFFENSKKRNQLLNYLENYINLNKMNGLKLLKVEARNFGKKLN